MKWQGDFQWDLVSRDIEMVWGQISSPFANSSLKQQKWHKALDEGNEGLLLERLGEKVEEHIRETQRIELDEKMVKKLDEARSRDKRHDFKVALLVFYNNEITEEEKCRRSGTLREQDADRACSL
jgi:hypothetical protein